MSAAGAYRAPGDCPVCGDRLVLTRLSCESCTTEVSGRFEPCPCCRLDDDLRALRHVFLVSRGNTEEIQRRLGVSYPTARARVTSLLAALGLEDEALSEEEPDEGARLALLQRLAAGEVDVDVALAELERGE